MDYKALRTNRRDYTRSELTEADLLESPREMFELWLRQATEVGIDEPNAMTLATVDADGCPSCRIVLLRSIDDDGLRFFTNYKSAKARDLAANPKVGVAFFWPELERQVRVRGQAEKLPPEVSDAYFRSRPKGSQLSAWASPQSETLADPAELVKRLTEVQERFADAEEVPRPDFWGGYLIRPEEFEFWQGRPSRRHDRFRYQRSANGWSVSRLAP
ncbi:MAG: pyridoxamine 5'-phosphate oxidase [Planctomycetota bacterium]